MFGHRREDDSAASEEFAQDTSTKLELPDLAEVGDLHPAAVRMDPALARFPERFAVGTSDRKRVVALGFVLFGIGAFIMILLNFNTFFGSLSQMQSGEERQPLGPMIPIMLAIVAVVGIVAGVRMLQRYSTEFRLAETNEALDSRALSTPKPAIWCCARCMRTTPTRRWTASSTSSPKTAATSC